MAAGERWEHFPHEADIGIRGIGASLEGCFEQAALALTAVVTDPARVTPHVTVAIQCAAPERALLLVDWINALVFEMATRRMLFGRFHVRIEDGKLWGTAEGEAVDVVRHEPAVEVKGATYTECRLEKGDGGMWVGQCVVDV